MKRLFAFLLCFALLTPALTGCGNAAAEQTVPGAQELAGDSRGAETLPSDGTGYIRPASTPEQPESETYDDWEALLEATYTREGNFFFKENELEDFKALPQDEPYSFVVHEEPGADADLRLDEWKENQDNMFRAEKIYSACQAGEPPEGDYDVDPNEYPQAKSSCAAGMLDKLPREWFELTEKVIDYIGKIRWQDYLDIRNEYELRSAELFTAAGCTCEVRSSTDIYDGQKETSYICIVTATPAQLWEISGQMENMYFIEQLYKTVDARFDTRVWPES